MPPHQRYSRRYRTPQQPDPPTPEESSSLGETLRKAKDTITIIGGLIGVFVALLFVAGRSFIHGMVNAMNIPMELINLSTWEYAESVWRHLLYLIIIVVAGGYVAAAVFIFLRGFTRALASAIRNQIKNRSRRLNPSTEEDHSPAYPVFARVFRLLLTGLVIGITASAIIYMVVLMQDEGAKFGRGYTENNLTQVEFISDFPLSLKLDPARSSTGGASAPMYVYTGYRFLFYNSGHYYVTDDIDLAACKPRQVHAINSEHLVQVNFFPIAKPACGQASPTPAAP